MATETFDGFPTCDISLSFKDDKFQERVNKIVDSLIDSQDADLPAATYERYSLSVVAPDAEEKDWQYRALWPITRQQYDAFWEPTIVVPEPPVAPKAEPLPPNALDIFQPPPDHDDHDESDDEPSPFAKGDFLRKARMIARTELVQSVLDGIADGPLVQSFLDSHGVFDRRQGEQAPLGFNLDGFEQNLYFQRDGKTRRLFDRTSSGRQTDGNSDIITGHYQTMDGSAEFHSDVDRAAWEAALRNDASHLTSKLKKVPQYYLDLLNERPYFASSVYYGTSRQLGTLASREFFSGYYQFAPEGLTLLRATKRLNEFGVLDYRNTEQVGSIASVDLAFKHRLTSQPHLVRLQTINSPEYDESVTEFRVFVRAHPLDGTVARHRIGGFYGELENLDDTLGYMTDDVKSRIAPRIMQQLQAGVRVGTEVTHFSHDDFYAIIGQLTRLALGDSGF